MWQLARERVRFPSLACRVQKELGAVNAAAFDLSAACSGFLYALNTVQAYQQAGIYKKALVIGTEVLSGLVDWKDRSTCVLFGDGAGAVVVGAEETGLEGFVQYADGRKGEVLTCKGGKRKKFFQEDQEEDTYLTMNGQEVFRFAVKKVPECIQQVMEKAGRKRRRSAGTFCIRQTAVSSMQWQSGWKSRKKNFP